MNKKNNGAKAQHENKKVVAHQPWELEKQTEGLDEGHEEKSAKKGEKSAKGEKSDKAAECGCKYF